MSRIASAVRMDTAIPKDPSAAQLAHVRAARHVAATATACLWEINAVQMNLTVNEEITATET